MSSQASITAIKRGKPGRVLKQRRTAARTQLVQTVNRLAAEVEALQQRLAQIERQGDKPAYYIPQSLAELGPLRLPPPGQTAMQAIMGKLEVDESIEELLAQLKANK